MKNDELLDFAAKLNQQQIETLVFARFPEFHDASVHVAMAGHFAPLPDAIRDNRVPFELGRYVQRAWENCYGNVSSVSVGKEPTDVAPSGEVHPATSKGYLDATEARYQKALDDMKDGNLVEGVSADDMRSDDEKVEDYAAEAAMALDKYNHDRVVLNSWLKTYAEWSGSQYSNVAWAGTGSSGTRAASRKAGDAIFSRMKVLKERDDKKKAA